MQNKTNHNELFLALYKPIHKELNAYCIAISKNREDAKDLMNDTIEIALNKFNQIKEKEKFKYFLFAIASKVFNNFNRKAINKNHVAIHTISIDIAYNATTDENIDHHFLKIALNKLDITTREIIILFELQGFSIKEISEILTMNENTIKTRLSRGREQLKNILNPQQKNSYGTR